MAQNQLKPADVSQVTTHVHQGAIDVLGRVTVPATVHQGKFSMGTVLGLIAVHGRAGLGEFDRDFLSPEVSAFREKVTMALDDEVDTAYPARWIGKVSVHTADGRTLAGRVDEPKGDPGNSLSRAEIEDKMQRLAHYGEGATADEAKALCERVWQLADTARVGRWLG